MKAHSSTSPSEGKRIHIPTADGYVLAGILYEPAHPKAAIVIHSATAVRQQIYAAYAQHLVRQDIAVLTFDYRGVSASGPARLPAQVQDSYWVWGTHDASAAAQYARSRWPNIPLGALGHSIGGVAIGLMPEIQWYESIVTYGAQQAYYQDWHTVHRWRLYLAWHVFQPLITQIVGYYPGRKLGKLEDIPPGVVRDWHARRRYADASVQLKAAGVALYFDQYRGQMLAIGAVDDPIGTVQALQRHHKLFCNAQLEVKWLDPSHFEADHIGHFGLFRRRFESTIWPLLDRWWASTLRTEVTSN